MRAPAHRVPAVLAALAAVGLGGCTGDCGTIEIWAEDRPEEPYDLDGDGDLDFTEQCGVNYGSFGYYYPDMNLMHVILSTEARSIEDTVDLTYAYTAVADIWVRWDHIAAGEGSVLETESIAGNTLLSRTRALEDLPDSYPLGSGHIEVVRDPVEYKRDSLLFADDEPFKIRLAWEIVYVDPTFGGPVHRFFGEDWVQVDLDDIVYNSPDDFRVLPPDYER
ncbi:MAG: hypothetical protein R3F61_01620 [Myxococcota bacterium]